MGQAAVKDDSMEGILASIRRIISSDVNTRNEKTEPDLIEDSDFADQPAKSAQPPLAPAVPQSVDAPKVAVTNVSAPTSHAPVPKTENIVAPSESLPTGGSFTEFAASVAVAPPQGTETPSQVPTPKVTDDPGQQTLAQSVKDLALTTPEPISKTEIWDMPSANIPVDAGLSKSAAPQAAAPSLAMAAASSVLTAKAADDTKQPFTQSAKESVPSTSELPSKSELADASSAKAPAVKAEITAPTHSSHAAAAKVEPATVAKVEPAIAAKVEPATATKVAPTPAAPTPVAKAPVVKESPNTAISDNNPSKFKEALVSPATQESVSSSMDRLKSSVKDLKAAQIEVVLRPMLREWLDANLADMVEKMVREEIDRLGKAVDEELN